MKRLLHPHHLRQMSSQYQELLQRIANDLYIPSEEVQDSQNWILDILQLTGPCTMALPVNEASMEPAKGIWHSPTPCTPYY